MKSLSVTIEMKATKQYFPVVLFIMLYKVDLTFEFVNEILSGTIQMKLKNYWVLLSSGAYAKQSGSNLSPWIKSVDKILKCDHSNESYWVVLFCGTVYYADLSRSDIVYQLLIFVSKAKHAKKN